MGYNWQKNKMKKLYVVIITALVLGFAFFVSCSKDEKNENSSSNGGNNDNNKLAGTWVIQEFRTSEYDESEYWRGETWTFNNGKFTGYWYEDDINCNYNYQNGKLTISGGDFYESEEGWSESISLDFTTVQIDGSVLTLSGNLIYKEVYEGETYTDSESIYVRLVKQGGNGGGSNVTVSDIYGMWTIQQFLYDDYDDQYAVNKGWYFNNDRTFRGYFNGDFYDSNWLYEDGILTILGGDLYESEDDWIENIRFDFTTVQISGNTMSLSGKLLDSYSYTSTGESGSYDENIYVRLYK